MTTDGDGRGRKESGGSQAPAEATEASSHPVADAPADESRRGRGLLAAITGEMFRENLGSVIAGGTAMLLATVGFFMSPLKTSVLHWIWDEDLEIVLVQSSQQLREGEGLDLSAMLVSKSRIPIGEGIAQFEFDSERLRRISGPLVVSVPEFDHVRAVGNESPLHLLALKPGTAMIAVTYKSSWGAYRKEGRVEIESAAPSGRPTPRNFTGKWNIRLGSTGGEMELLDRGGAVSGNYLLDDGEQGAVSGVRDGSVFHVDLIRPGNLSKWEVQANWKKNGDFLEIQGQSVLQAIRDDEWRASEAEPARFYGSAHLFAD